MGKVLEMDQVIILLNFRDKSTTLPKFRLVRIINSRSKSSGYSLKSNPSITSDKYVQKHGVDLKIDLLLLQMLKFVLNVTYLTKLHRCRQDSQKKVTYPKPIIKI